MRWGDEAWHWDGAQWRQIDLPTDEPLAAVKVMSADLIYIVGHNGTLLAGNARDGFRDQSAEDDNQNFTGVEWFGDRLFLVSNFGMFTFDPATRKIERHVIDLKPDLKGHAHAGSQTRHPVVLRVEGPGLVRRQALDMGGPSGQSADSVAPPTAGRAFLWLPPGELPVSQKGAARAPRASRLIATQGEPVEVTGQSIIEIHGIQGSRESHGVLERRAVPGSGGPLRGVLLSR